MYNWNVNGILYTKNVPTLGYFFFMKIILSYIVYSHNRLTTETNACTLKGIGMNKIKLSLTKA